MAQVICASVCNSARRKRACAGCAPLSLLCDTKVFSPCLVLCCHSSTARGSVRDFSQSVTKFICCYMRTLSVPRVTNFMTLLLKAIRERSIGSTGALCAIFAAFDFGGTKVPAMGRDLLFQLKEMLLVVLPPLNQVN